MYWLLWLILLLDETTKRLAHPCDRDAFAVEARPAQKWWHVFSHYRRCLYFIHRKIHRQCLIPIRRSLNPLAIKNCRNCGSETRLGRAKVFTLLQLQVGSNDDCPRCRTLLLCISKFSDHWSGRSYSEIIVEVQHGSSSPNSQTLVLTSLQSRSRAGVYPVGGERLLSLSVLYGERRPTGQLRRGQEFGRSVPLHSQSDQCFTFIRKRIEECLLHHDLCNIRHQNSFVPTRLIDTQPGGLPSDAGPEDLRLVESVNLHDGHSIRYVALSYCWGEANRRVKPIPKLTTKTVSDRLRHISWAELTRTFEDAIVIARRLSIRYVWIDALCIKQDDAADFAVESSRLASIYGNAYLVVSATRAASGDIGIFHDRLEPYEVPYIDTWGRFSVAYVKKSQFHLDFSVNDPTHFQCTPVFSRAWCFQERLLASRIVHFAEAEIVWECNEQLHCECGSLDVGTYYGTNFKTRQARRLLLPTEGDQELDLRDSYWNECIHSYTSRHLTYESDRLPAISGFARELWTPSMGHYMAGLWEFRMPSTLLWFITHPRLESKIGQIHRPKDSHAPSWSWTSIEGTILLWHAIHRKVVAKLVDFSCVPATSDTFGQIRPGAYIVLEAPTLEVVLESHSTTMTQWGSRPSGSIMLVQNERAHVDHKNSNLEPDLAPHQFLADLDLASPDHPDYIAIGSRLICAVIEISGRAADSTPSKCLVLTPRRPSQNQNQNQNQCTEYRRVGLFDCPESWLRLAKRRRVKIL